MLRALLVGSTAALALSASAFAADLPSRKAPPAVAYAPVAAFSWTGFYVGVEGGLDFIATKGTFTDNLGGARTGTFTTNSTSGLLGGLAGYNYQVGQFVVGLEGNLDAVLSGKKSASVLDSASNSFLVTTKTTYAGDIRGRLGFAIDRALVFVAGGVAFGDAKATIYNPTTAVTAIPSVSAKSVGYTLGAGVDYAFTNEWIGRAEYRYSSFGSKSSTYAGVVRSLTSESVKSSSSAVLLGLIYKFGAPAAPVVAKY